MSLLAWLLLLVAVTDLRAQEGGDQADSAPAPATDIRVDWHGRVSWTASVDDWVSGGAVVGERDSSRAVVGYRVYRTDLAVGDVDSLIGVTDAGVTSYQDSWSCKIHIDHRYTVWSYNVHGETDPGIEPGSAADRARRVSFIAEFPAVRVGATVTFAAPLPETDTWIDSITASVAAMVEVDAARLLLTVADPWVTFSMWSSSCNDEGTPAGTAIERLVERVEAGAATPLDALGPILEVRRGLDLMYVPIDAQGEVVLGWFTRVEDSVGLADFFAFADEYGKTATDLTFNELFDIAPDPPDGAIDLVDFFAFADHFGRIVANAQLIREALR